MGLDDRVTLFLLADGSSLTFDTSEVIRYSQSVDVTEHPIEDGSVVSDHAQIRARNWTLRAAITETPYDTAIRGDSGPVTGPARLARAVAFLDRVLGQPLFFSGTKGRRYGNALITSWDDEDSLAGVKWFSLAFKQIRIAQATTVEIPATRPRQAQQTGMGSATDSGVQPTSANTADADGASVAWSLDNATGGHVTRFITGG